MLCNSLPPANGSKVILLIIDPQVDFHEPGGSLAVAGSKSDALRTADLIRDNISKIDEIYVTLDSHNKMHIAHGAFWSRTEDGKGPGPGPFTQLMHDDKPNSTALYTVTADGNLDLTQAWYPKNHESKAWCKEYSMKLCAGENGFRLIIWPEHCLIGTPGNAVQSDINAALQEWAAANHTKTIKYIPKGINNFTEMYSVIEAEVSIASDPISGGSMNVDLLNALGKAHKLLVCGQALSHCVNYTVRDLVKYWYTNPGLVDKPTVQPVDIILLTDAMSPVTGFESAGTQFIKDMQAKGLTTCNCVDIKL
jgi:nicotinamidase/pyrazinamidase